MRHHADGRREFWGDIFELPNGDLNVVKLKPHVPIAWHRHQRQTDRLFLVSGKLRVGIVGDAPEFFTLMPGQTLTIPQNRFHGYEAIGRNTVVVQFNGPGKYDGSDEERHPIDAEMPW